MEDCLFWDMRFCKPLPYSTGVEILEVAEIRTIPVVQFTKQSTAATLGLFAAPLVPTMVSAFYSGTGSTDLLSAFYGASLVYATSLLLGGLLGLPLFHLLGRLRLVKSWALLLGGFLVGGASGALMILLMGMGFDAVPVYGVQGIGAAAVFWIFWRLGPNPSAD